MKTAEHRKTTRRSCLVPVEGKEGSVFSDIYSIDISRSGLGFVSRHNIKLNQTIAVEVELGPGQDPVVMLGQVKWVRPIESNDQYRVGMKFVKVLTSGSRSRLTDFFKEHDDGSDN